MLHVESGMRMGKGLGRGCIKQLLRVRQEAILREAEGSLKLEGGGGGRRGGRGMPTVVTPVA